MSHDVTQFFWAQHNTAYTRHTKTTHVGAAPNYKNLYDKKSFIEGYSYLQVCVWCVSPLPMKINPSNAWAIDQLNCGQF